MSFVPLPWCTSQSRTSTRSAPRPSSARRAAIATLLNRQKPIARAASAWWPGGRSPQKVTSASPDSSASTARTAPPAECSAASNDRADATVSMSSIPPPCSLIAAMRSTYARGCTASTALRSAGGASSRS